METRMALLTGALVVGQLTAGAGVGRSACPPGQFTISPRKGIVPFTALFVDPVAKQVVASSGAASKVHVGGGAGATRIRARWSLSDSDSPWTVAVVLRTDTAHCDVIDGHAKWNRRLLRRLLGGGPLPRGLPTYGTFVGERTNDTSGPEIDCSNAAGGPDVATVGIAPGGDLDLGWTGVFHDVRGAAGGRVAFCLDGCDARGESVCRATAVSGVPYGAPVPALAGGVPLCLVPTVFGSTQTGTVDMATGAMDLPIRVGVGIHVTSPTAVCPRCEDGSCTDGATAGAPCTVDTETIIHGGNGAGTTYRLSGDCLPGPDALVGEIPIDLELTTGTASLSGSPPCFAASQPPPPDDACGDAACGGICSTASDAGEVCCVGAPDRSCFPTRDGGAIARSGEAGVPSAAGGPWPDPVYPKQGHATVVAVSCAGSSGNSTVDASVGLPGPVALRLPVAVTVEKGVNASSEQAR